MAGVAILTKKMGYEVSGCDLFAETYYSKSLKQVGIEPFLGHNERHLKGIDLLVISPAVLAVNPTNPEVEMAKKKGILLTWQEFVGKYLQVGKTVIAVAGAHGKSTTDRKSVV